MSTEEVSIADIAVLRETLERIGPRTDKMIGYFYAKLFVEYPEVRELFPVQMNRQRTRFTGALLQVLQALEQGDRAGVDGFLGLLGQIHRTFEVQPYHYAAFGRCLIAALEEYSAGYWSPAVEGAWVDAYELMSRKMLAAASAVPQDAPAFWEAEVIRFERRSSDIAVFTVLPTRPYPYRPGQFALVSTSHRPQLWRPINFANAPRPDGTLELHIRIVAAGWVSSALVWRGRPGDKLRIGPPMGLLEVDQVSVRDVLFIAGGTGLSTVKSLLEDMVTWNRGRGATVFFGGKTRDDLYDLAALHELARRHHRLTVVPVVENDPGFAAEQGLLPDVVSRRGPWLRHDVYVSGSAAMIRATTTRLEADGVPSERIHYDPYEY
jgi:NAD(P)H-flavin reductase/hemoglobin-like flavoprotein